MCLKNDTLEICWQSAKPVEKNKDNSEESSYWALFDNVRIPEHMMDCKHKDHLFGVGKEKVCEFRMNHE